MHAEFYNNISLPPSPTDLKFKMKNRNLCIVQVWVPPSNRDVWKSASCYSVVKRQISILKPAVSAGCHFLPDIGQPSCPPLPQNGPQENSIHTHPIHPDCMAYFWLSLICLPAKKIKIASERSLWLLMKKSMESTQTFFDLIIIATMSTTQHCQQCL